jgi:spermidine/putrescine transport system ATP-binding protein
MFVDTDKGYELMIQDYNAFEPESEVGLIIRPADIQVMKKERTVNTFEGEIVDENHVKFLEETFECKPQNKYAAGEKVNIEINFSKVELIDHPEEGMLSGEVTSVTFKGVHFEIIVDINGFKWMIQATDYEPVGANIGLYIEPDAIHIMKKSEYSGVFGDYSSYSDELEKLSENIEEENE